MIIHLIYFDVMKIKFSSFIFENLNIVWKQKPNMTYYLCFLIKKKNELSKLKHLPAIALDIGQSWETTLNFDINFWD